MVDALVVDELQVISDLHLGGEAPFQMFRESAALSSWIDSISPGLTTASVRRALVINGDFIDFLAEKPASHFDPRGAPAKLRRIAADPAFKPVFEALRRFLDVQGHRLGIVLGNHDVELALPWVRRALESMLCDEAPENAKPDYLDAARCDARRGRLIWSLEGQGILIRMGEATGPRVLCIHGNEVDDWNIVDHDAIRRLGREGERGQPLGADYVPNAGSRMVIEVMNAIKRRYPFVDLLKPETEAVVPTLLALDPNAASALRKMPAIRATKGLTQLRRAVGLLGGAGEPDVGRLDGAAFAEELAGEQAWDLNAGSAARARYNEAVARKLLDEAERGMKKGTRPLDLTDIARADMLGPGSALWAVATGKDRVEVLRQQLKDLADDRSFSYFVDDDTSRDLQGRIPAEIDFVVTGHTHLARALVRGAGGAYFNTGTWARVFQIEPDALFDPKRFGAVYMALGSPDITALDGVADLRAVRPHLAAFWCDPKGVWGELRTVAATAPYVAKPVDGTRFFRS